MTPYVTTWDEGRMLDYFWRMVREDADRIALLRQLSGVALERSSDWDYWSVRQQTTWDIRAGDCFACKRRDDRLTWHHVIWVKHGGSNRPVNLVALCQACHRRVHPWLPPVTRMRGLVPIAALIPWGVHWLRTTFARKGA